ncbi:MAG TPA: ABC transporter permease [Pyrinomonadaceae bacterium]|nr:ABC transporter permease [Pyrinomonadaceae bacterium]
MLEDLRQDLRFGLRGLRKSPTFTLAAVITLALGIGANTAIFSAVNALLLRPLPYDDAGRLVWIWGDNKQLGVSQAYLSPGDILDFGRQSTRLESVAAWTTVPVNLVEQTRSERLEGVLVSPNFFRTLGVRVAAGRDFEPDEGRQGRNQFVIISDGLWRRRYGADPGVIGRRLTLDRYDVNSFTVVGVAPPGVQFPLRTDVWMPDLDEEGGDARGGRDMRAVARLKPGATLGQAQDELNVIAQTLERQFPNTNTGWRVTLTSARDVILGTPYRAVWVLLGAVGCVLLIACANVANLQLARAAGRGQEIALRAALGAGRGRIVRQLLTESVLLALIGGAIGLLLAWWGVGLLRALSPDTMPRLRDAGIDGRVLAFTAAAALFSGLAFGLIPALQSSRPDLMDALKVGARGTAAAEGGGRPRGALVVAEVAVTALLLVGAGLLLKSFWLLTNVAPGFEADRVLTAGISLNRDMGAQTSERHRALFSQAIERVRQLPGVETVGAISHLPFGGRGVNLPFTLPGREPPPDAGAVRAELRVVNPEYFEAMGIAVRRGRAFTAQDTDASPKALVVNEAFARLFLRDSDPLGRRVRINLGRGFEGEVVGVVGDVRHRGYDADPRPEMYVSYLQQTVWPVMNLVIRTGVEPASLTSAVRGELERIDPTAAVFNVRPMNEFLSDYVAERRLNLLLLLVFASVSLATAAVGIFGVTAYAVTQRRREIGIRMALGARPGDVLRLVVGRGTRLIVCGVCLGLVAAFVLTRLMAGMFYGVSASDPATFTLVGLSLCAVAVLACYVPASRAAKVDPLTVLRGE